MGADVRRSETTPRVFWRRDDDGTGGGDRNRRVFGLGRDAGEADRDRMRSGVAPLQPRDRWGCIGVAMVSVIDRGRRRDGVDMRGHAVLVLRVLMARIRVHVLERRRPGGREQRAHHEGRNESEHHGECMFRAHFRQILS
jgi:hypothetical protein